ANLSYWNSTDLSHPYVDHEITTTPDKKMKIYYLSNFIINSVSYQGTSYQSNFGNDKFNSYSGIVGNATINNTNRSIIPLVIPVATANNEASIPNCYLNNVINFPFTKIDINTSTSNSVEVRGNLNATFNIRPNLQIYVCDYATNNKVSYDWAQQFSVIALIFISILELLKAVLLIQWSCLYMAKQYSLIAFSSYSPIILVFLFYGFIKCQPGVFVGIHKIILATRDFKDAEFFQLFGDLLLHSLPMLTLSIQNIIYNYNENHQYPSTISILSFVDCGFNIIPLVFIISLAVQGFKIALIFIIPLLVIFAKLLVCFSQFFTSRFRKPLKSPLVFSMAMNSPFLLFCIISSPIRQLVIITASSGVTIWSCWPLDFVAIDIPIAVTIILMNISVWRIISGCWYLSISLSVRTKENNTHNQSTEEIDQHSFFDSFKRRSPIHGIPIYTLFKLFICPDPTIYVVVSPKILMVLGLVIFLSLDFIGSLALLISYYSPFSIQALALYLNSPFLVFLLLHPQFRAKIIAAVKLDKHKLLVWKLRDLVLISSLLLIWPGLGFGYMPYNNHDKYTWWLWYGWFFDKTLKSSQSSSTTYEGYWSLCGFLCTILLLIYCERSILLNTMPSDTVE
ncbi:21045_t:CDS:2, partial [Racocetra persica]